MRNLLKAVTLSKADELLDSPAFSFSLSVIFSLCFEDDRFVGWGSYSLFFILFFRLPRGGSITEKSELLHKGEWVVHRAFKNVGSFGLFRQ